MINLCHYPAGCKCGLQVLERGETRIDDDYVLHWQVEEFTHDDKVGMITLPGQPQKQIRYWVKTTQGGTVHGSYGLVPGSDKAHATQVATKQLVDFLVAFERIGRKLDKQFAKLQRKKSKKHNVDD